MDTIRTRAGLSGRLPNTDWKQLVSSSALSNTADRIRLVAFPLLTVPFGVWPVSLVTAAGAAQGLLMSSVSGVIADRGNRKRLIVAS